MKVLLGDHRTWDPVDGGSALTIGVFDGVHRGHRYVLDRLRERARGRPVAVLTFDRHPLSVIAPQAAPDMVTTVPQRMELLASAGVDVTGVLTFDERLRSLDAAGFVDELVVGVFTARTVVVGEDFRFGRDRAGDVGLLRHAGARRGFDVVGLTLLGDTAPVSSTAIRSALAGGDVAAAHIGLGRPFQLRGIVVEGDGRGRLIGFPTANLDIPEGLVIPANGVYAAVAGIEDARHPAVVNIGVRPTFGGTRRVVEVHLLAGGADLYGSELRVDFVARVRDERRFDGTHELVDQIGRDVAAAAAILDA